MPPPRFDEPVSRLIARAMATLSYSAGQAKSTPVDTPVLVIGQVQNLQGLGFAPVRSKLDPVVTEQVARPPPSMGRLQSVLS